MPAGRAWREAHGEREVALSYLLYWSPNTGALVVEALLIETGAPFAKELVDTRAGMHRRPDYLALNPMGQVPALRLPDGTVITESAAMLLHLAGAFPDAGLMPAPGSTARAVAYRWLLLLAAPYYEADLRYFYPERYTTDPNGTEGIKAAAEAQLTKLLAIIEDALEPGPYLLGRSFSAVDLYLFMVALWHPARHRILDRFPRLARHLGDVRRRPSIMRLWTDYYPPEQEHPWSTWTGSNAS